MPDENHSDTPPEFKVSQEDLRHAETVMGIEFTDSEREQMHATANEYRGHYEAIRAQNIDNATPPAFTFDPRSPNQKSPPIGKTPRALYNSSTFHKGNLKGNTVRKHHPISLLLLVVGFSLTLAACGTKAETPNATFVPTSTFDASSRVSRSVSNKSEDGEHAVAVEPTATLPPTETPTEAPTEVPTEAPTEIPTEVPTEAPTEIPAPTGNAANGQILFQTQLCSSCHFIDQDLNLVGPSLMNIETVAPLRKAGYTAEQYIHESIVDPNIFVVPGFQAGLMPATFGTTLTEEQINDLIAYLLAP